MKNRFRLAAIFACILCAFALTGCGASITVYEYSTSGGLVNEIELFIDNQTVEAMEKTAIADEYGIPYTVENYFYTFFTDNGYDIVSAKSDGAGYSVVYRKIFPNGTTTDLYQAGTKPEYSYKYKRNPFVVNVVATSPNPFNGAREAFDGITNPNVSATVLQQLKNGKVAVSEYGERIELFPSVTEAFPFLDGMDPSGLLLTYARADSSRKKSSGKKYRIDRDNSWYVYSRYFDAAEPTVEVSYNRPVPYGWYLIALAAGGLTVAMFILKTREKQEKPTLLDRFPYNPEEYRDYESHLPIERK